MGTVVLSIDAELCWGFQDLASPPSERLSSGRSGWKTLLSLCDEFEVPATWAVVGHVMLDTCDRKHLEHPTPPDWFEHEREPDATPDVYRYGRELVEATKAADVGHDIGCQPFSHVELGASTTSPKLARAELAASIHAARALDIEPTSFVFPSNNVGNRQALAAYGIRCYRGCRPCDRQSNGVTRPLRTLAWRTGRTAKPPLVRPKIDSFGLINVPASLFLFGCEGLTSSVLERFVEHPIVRQAKHGIDAAAKSDAIFHMWLHPHDLTSDRDVGRLREIFGYLNRRRADSKLRIETMAGVAEAKLAEREWIELEPT